jgi:uncharacterized membrane protein/predicted flap endonuclease-1-like 5' DNA nuclease
MEEKTMPEKYIFVVIEYPQAGTAMQALTAIMELMQNNIASIKDAVAVTKTEFGDLELHRAQDDPARQGFLDGRLIGIIFADLFGVTGWDMNDALAGTAFAMLGQGIQDLLLEEFGEKMTPAESAVVLLVEHAKWRKAADSMRPHNFQGTMVISQNVIGDLSEMENQLEDETMVLLLPAPEAESIAPALAMEAEPPVSATEEKQEIPAAMPEKLVIPIPKGLKYIEGIGDVFYEKLRQAGIRNVEDLLDKGCDPRGREEIAATTGISEKLVLRWVNQADLYRIRGIGKEYAELLEAAGVDTVPELAQRVPANLCEKMTATNAQRNMVRRLPILSQVESWVTQAKNLPRKITY